MNNVICYSIATLFFISSSIALAHSEHDRARFVAPNGKDNSSCDNVLRPCKTIAYAVSQANKGDKILVSSGQYAITSSEELFLLKSNIVPIFGGYNRFDHYQSQSPHSNITKLSNVPSEMVDELRAKGFSVMADGKSLIKDKELQKKLADFNKLNQSQKNISCTNGKADIFDCNNIDLLAHLPLSRMSGNPSDGSDVWGHVDLNTGREYAIMALYNGTIVVDVTEPTDPQEIGTIAGVGSTWRDVKVYQYFDKTINLWQAYAYVTTEGSSSGATDHVSILDLNNLPNQVTLVTKSQIVGTAHNIYISNIDHTLNVTLPNETASLQIVGAPNRSGAFHSYSLENPTQLLGENNHYGNGYTHDGSSLTISDQRVSSDCGLALGTCTVFIDFNEKEMKLWNITNPQDTKLLGTAEYDDVIKNYQYVHSGWGTEDQQFILLHDEFDEYRGGLNTTVRIFSIEDLNNPVQVGQWTGPTTAIDHNGFVRGNRYYMSNYERGLTILDISDPTNPSEIGFFDTYTPSNNPSFNGAWGVYPFLPSGNILVSDINSGLYILKDKTKTVNTGAFSFNSRTINTEQATTLSIYVARNGVSLNESVSVSYQLIPGSADADTDFIANNQTLSWQAKDNTTQTISVEIKPDPTSLEYPENFFIRLYNPSHGSTLGENSYATINIAGIEDSGAGSFTLSEDTVAENAGNYLIDVNRLGSTSGELTFDYQISSNQTTPGEDIEYSTGQVSWADGDNATKQISITIIDDDIEENTENFTVSLVAVNNARIGTNSEITITIADDDKNSAPQVSVNEDFQVNTGQQVTLSATANDTDNDEMTYSWTQTAGDNVTLSNADSLSTTFTAPSAANTLTFEFTATDFRNASSSASVNVTVIAPTTTNTNTSSGGSGSSGGGSASWLILLACFALSRRALIISINRKR